MRCRGTAHTHNRRTSCSAGRAAALSSVQLIDSLRPVCILTSRRFDPDRSDEGRRDGAAAMRTQKHLCACRSVGRPAHSGAPNLAHQRQKSMAHNPNTQTGRSGGSRRRQCACAPLTTFQPQRACAQPPDKITTSLVNPRTTSNSWPSRSGLRSEPAIQAAALLCF